MLIHWPPGKFGCRPLASLGRMYARATVLRRNREILVPVVELVPRNNVFGSAASWG